MIRIIAFRLAYLNTELCLQPGFFLKRAGLQVGFCCELMDLNFFIRFLG